MKKSDVLITGLGGQGGILASDVLAEAAMTAGYDVKKTDTLGMAQRGGSVVSHVRLAEHVWSPLIKEGEVGILLAFEKLEAVRWVSYLKSGCVSIINNYALPPLAVVMGNEHYPADEEIINILKQRTERISFVNGTERVIELGNARGLNIFMLGCASLFLPIEVPAWHDSIVRYVPSKAKEINIAAFDMGRKEMSSVSIG